MAGRVTIRFQGAEDMRAKFLAMAEEARTRTLQQAVPPAAEIAAEAMREAVPVDTGKLRDSIGMKVLEQGPGRLVMTMKTPAPHWHLIEFGHVQTGHKPNKVKGAHVPAHSFIRAPFQRTRTAMKNEIRDGIRDSIEGFTK